MAVPNVLPKSKGTSAWGNQVANTINAIYAGSFATPAALLAAVPSPTKGQLAWVDSLDMLLVFAAAGWRPLGGTVEAPPIPPTTEEPTPVPDGAKFTVVGKDIIDPRTGLKFVPVGTNMWPSPRGVSATPGWVWFCNGHAVEAANDWKMNTVRLFITNDNVGGATWQNTILGAIDVTHEYISRGIVVIPAFWPGKQSGSYTALGTNPSWAQIQSSGLLDLLDAFTDEFRDEPLVWHGLLNEPWNGNDFDGWVARNDQMYDYVVDQGWQNPVLIDLPQWGQSLDSGVRTRAATFAGSHPQAIFGLHPYGTSLGTPSSGNVKAWLDDDIPLMVAEIGTHWNDSETEGSPIHFGTARTNAGLLYTHAEAWGIGFVTWVGAFNTSDPLTLRKADGAPFWATNIPLSTVGQYQWDLGHALSGGTPPGPGGGGGGSELQSYTFTGSNGAGPPSGITETAGTVDIQSNRLRLLPDAAGYDEAYADFTVSPPADFEAECDLYIAEKSEHYAGIMYRSTNGADVYAAGFHVHVNVVADAISIRRWLSTADTYIASQSYTIAATDTLHIRLLVEGNRHRVRVWKNSETEPGTWLIDVTSTNPGAGLKFGLEAQAGASANPGSFFDNVVLSEAP